MNKIYEEWPEWIELILSTRRNLKEAETVMNIIDLYLNIGKVFYPERFSIPDFYEDIRFKGESDLKRIKEILSFEDALRITFTRYKPHYAELVIARKLWEGRHRISGRYSPSGCVSLLLEERVFKKNAKEFSSLFIEWGKKVYALINPYYGHGDYAPYVTKTVDAIQHISKEHEIIPMIYWLNFLGPDFVNLIGREKILKAPFWKIEEFRDGGLLLISAPTPFESLSEKGFKRRKEIYEFLGLEGIEIDIGELEKKFLSH